MMAQGQMAKADVVQLEAQLNSAKYSVVNTKTQLANYKRQLKALLELDLNTPFDTDTVFWFDTDPLTEEHNYRCTGVARTINQVVLALAEIDRTAAEVVSA